MVFTQQEKIRLRQVVTSDLLEILKKIANDVIERSWKIRRVQDTADKTLKVVSFGEGVESGAMEIINLVQKYGQ